MKVNILPGKYILAVSGGVDSMTLLDLLAKQKDLELVVAHFNHGIRVSSGHDEDFVRHKAKSYNLAFEPGHGNLGPLASETSARRARYNFLKRILEKHKADAIITAHHQDDLIETALINTLRGTGPKGLIAIASNKGVLRPLLPYSKREILAYAKQQNLDWVEDETNEDTRYLRNYIRNQLMPKMNQAERKEILAQIEKVAATHQKIESVIAKISQKVLIDEKTMNRSSFISLPSEVANNLLLSWLNQLKIRDIDRKTIIRLSIALKTGAAGSQHKIKNGSYLKLTKKEAYFTP